MLLCLSQTIDAYELSEKLSGHQLDEKEVERIAEDFIREQATLEFVDDTVSKIALCTISRCNIKHDFSFLIFDYRFGSSRTLVFNTKRSFCFHCMWPLGSQEASIIAMSYFGGLVFCFRICS